MERLSTNFPQIPEVHSNVLVTSGEPCVPLSVAEVRLELAVELCARRRV